MNTLSGARPLDPRLAGGAWSAAPATASTPGASRWLDGLAQGDSTPLSADLPAGSQGLSAAEHAQRVLSALLGDERA